MAGDPSSEVYLNAIQFSYLLTYREIQEAYEFGNRSKLRQARWGGALLIVIGGIVAAIDLKNLYAVGFVMMTAGAYTLVRSLRGLRRWYDREKIQGKTYEATIADTGIAIRGPKSTGQYEWAYFDRYRSTPNATVLFYGKRYIVFPNSALDLQGLENLREVIAKHLEPTSEVAEKPTKLQIFLVLAVLGLAIYFLFTTAHDLLSNGR